MIFCLNLRLQYGTEKVAVLGSPSPPLPPAVLYSVPWKTARNGVRHGTAAEAYNKRKTRHTPASSVFITQFLDGPEVLSTILGTCRACKT